jgi:cytochrome b561
MPIRYTATAQALHWIVALMIFAVLPLAWVMVNLPPNTHQRDVLVLLHKSIGITVLPVVAARLIWRALHPAPPLPGSLARWERAAALASHWMLYAILVGMPVTGYILSCAGGHPVLWFGLFTLPGVPIDKPLAASATWLHVAIGQWLVYALVLLHLAATAWHVAVRRDGTLERMLPAQTQD